MTRLSYPVPGMGLAPRAHDSSKWLFSGNLTPIEWLGTGHAIRLVMTSQRAATLRMLINSLAIELESVKTAAEIRNLKLAIRSAEFELTNG